MSRPDRDRVRRALLISIGILVVANVAGNTVLLKDPFKSPDVTSAVDTASDSALELSAVAGAMLINISPAKAVTNISATVIQPFLVILLFIGNGSQSFFSSHQLSNTNAEIFVNNNNFATSDGVIVHQNINRFTGQRTGLDNQ